MDRIWFRTSLPPGPYPYDLISRQGAPLSSVVLSVMKSLLCLQGRVALLGSCLGCPGSQGLCLLSPWPGCPRLFGVNLQGGPHASKMASVGVMEVPWAISFLLHP